MSYRSDMPDCPFCGKRRAQVRHSGKWGFFVACSCSAVGPGRRTASGAEEAWGERREPEPDNQPTLF